MMHSINNLFILEPYDSGQGIRPEVRGGLSLPGQKLNLKPLKIVVDSVVDGKTYKAGATAYIAENLLMTHQWAKDVRTAPGVEGSFIVVESKYVSIVTEEP